MGKSALIVKSNQTKTRHICIDTDNLSTILEYVNRTPRHLKEFRKIIAIIIDNLKNRELYDKEEINDRCKGMRAMKFFKGGTNDRIYCKEYSKNGINYVVLGELLEKKKNQKNKERENNCIERIAKHDYTEYTI